MGLFGERSARGAALQVGLLVGFAAVVTGIVARVASRPAADFPVFHRAGELFRAGADLYGGAWEYPYRYAPGVAALFAPLSRLPLPTARLSWAAISAALAWAVAAMLAARRRRALAVPLAWLCLLQPLAQELAHGQVDVLVLFLLVAAGLLEDTEAEGAAGALVALAAALKVAPVLLALDWAVRRRWRALAGVAAGGLLLVVAGVLRYGPAGAVEQHLRWLATQSSDAAGMTTALANQSLWSMAGRGGLPFSAAAVAAAVLVAVLLTTRDRTRRRNLLAAAVPLVSAYGWPQLFILAVPLLAELLDGPPATAWLAGACAAGVSLLSYDVAGMRAEGWAQDLKLMGGLLLALVLIGRVAAERRENAPELVLPR